MTIREVVIGEGFADALASAKRGEEAGFEVMHRDLAPVLYGFARGRGAPDPDDVVTDTLVAVARDVAGFVGDEAGFRSWVFSICWCRLVDNRRRAKRRPEVRPLRPADDHPSGPTPEDVALGRMGDRRVVEALARLKPDQRDVVLLRVVAERPVREVAAMLGKKESAVKMIQLRALEQLRTILQAERQLAPAGQRSASEQP